MPQKATEKQVADLRSVTQLSCRKGTYDYSPYFHGMANGLILALAILEDVDPKYLDPPKKWLCGTGTARPGLPSAEKTREKDDELR